MEKWSDIVGYEGLYRISNLGRVLSLCRTVISRNNKTMTYPEKFLSLKPHKNTGYVRVALCKNGGIEIKRVHRLVAEAFIPNPEGKPQVNHLDGDKTDNSEFNLKWATSSENNQHAHDIGLASNDKGFEDSQSKAVKNCRGEIFGSVREASRVYGVYHSNIIKACTGRYGRSTTGKYDDGTRIKWTYYTDSKQ